MRQTLFTLLGILFLLSSSNTATAQNFEEDIRKLYGGAEIGLSLPAILNQNNYGYSELNYKVSTAVQFSVHAGVDIHNKHNIQAGIQFGSSGQSYKDIIGDTENEKEVNFTYLYVPITYKRVLGEQRGFAYGKLNTYLLGGIQPGFMTSSSVDWFIDGAEVEMLDFINQKDNNQNYDLIVAEQGTDFSDSDLYRAFDLNILFGGGFQYFQTERIMVYFELRGGVGVMDINDNSWRYDNNKGVYRPSLNSFASIRIGVNYYLKNGF